MSKGRFTPRPEHSMLRDPAHEGLMKKVDIDLSSTFTDKKISIFGHQFLLASPDFNIAATLTVKLHDINNLDIPIFPYTPVQDVFIREIFLTNILAQNRTISFIITEYPTILNTPIGQVAADLFRPATLHWDKTKADLVEPMFLVPDAETWTIQFIRMAITTSDNAGDRYIGLNVYDDAITKILYQHLIDYPQPASTTIIYSGMNLAIEDSSPIVIGSTNRMRFPLPTLTIKSGGGVSIALSGFSANPDAYNIWLLIHKYKFTTLEAVA